MLSQGGPRGAQGGLKAAVQAHGRLLLSWRKLSLELLERMDALQSLSASAASIDSYATQLEQQQQQGRGEGLMQPSAFEAAFPLAAAPLRGRLLQELRSGQWAARQVLQLMADTVVAMEAQAAAARGVLAGQVIANNNANSIIFNRLFVSIFLYICFYFMLIASISLHALLFEIMSLLILTVYLSIHLSI